MSIAAVVRESHEVHIDDRNLYRDPEGRKISERLRQFKPDVVGITSLTGPAILDGVLVSRLAKDSGAQVVWGGTHASLMPEQTLRNPYIDFVVIKEGEATFRELLSAIEQHRGYSGILGLGFKENGELRINPDRPFLEDLDALPMPAWDLVPVERYIYRHWPSSPQSRDGHIAWVPFPMHLLLRHGLPQAEVSRQICRSNSG
jgi:radical SAM superfamily enzyme YgiQ (UPF0313 family)